MKRLAVLFSICALVACSFNDQSLDGPYDNIINSLMITKGSEDFFQRDFSISPDDVRLYLKFHTPKGKEVVEIAPIAMYDERVQGYLVTFNDGWVLLSADKKTNPILAESSKGSFSLDEHNESNVGRLMLINSFLSEVNVIQGLHSAEDVKETLGEKAMEQIERNVLFWDLITDPNRVLSEPETKVEPSFVYILDEIEYDTVTVELVNHLTETRWTQSYPYNQYFPYTDYTLTNHAPTGCVPLAGAQMLYYLHYYCGVPEYAPDQAFVGGSLSFYTWNQIGSSSTAWDDMNGVSGAAEAVLIADIANKANVTFFQINGECITGTSTDSLIDVFNEYGIDIEYYNYSPDSVKYYIMERGLPVIADAVYNLSDPLTGHCFIIDAGLKGQQRATYYYKKVYQDGTEGTGYHEYHYYGYIWKWGINWGFGPGYDYDWYLSTGNWTVNSMSFNYNRATLLGYNIINN